MIKIARLACGVMAAALTVGTASIHAQFPAPPSLPSDFPAPQLPQRDTAAEVKEMTKRYGLSEDQATKVTAILEDHAKKADAVVKDHSLSPEQSVQSLLGIKDDEIKLVSEVLTPEQRKKYEADVHPAGSAKPPENGESKPPSPTSE